MKIRSTGMAAKIVKALGGIPVAMPMGETYDALDRGVVEGFALPQEALIGWKLGEKVKFTTESFGSAYSTGFFVVMNKAKWAALPPDVQKIIEQVNEEWIEKQGKLWNQLDKEGKEYAIQKGVKFAKVSKEEDAKVVGLMKPILDEYVKTMQAKGLPAAEALKFCQDYLKANP